MRRTRWVALALALGLTGCAKAPSSGSNNSVGTQIIVTMTVAGNINPNYHYYVLFNNANDPNGTNGPVPVVTTQDTSSNGFATGRVSGGGFTQYVSYDGSGPDGGFDFRAVSPPGTDLRTTTSLGKLLTRSVIGNTIQFSFPLSRLATTAVPAGQINYLQINFVTTNTTSVNPQDSEPKYFDALGNPFEYGTVNDYITIPAQQPRVYNDSTSGPGSEGPGDVAYYVSGSYQHAGNGDPNDPATQEAPDLDITGYTIEVRG